VSETEMKYLDLHGDRVAYREAGAGEALLLIHGMARSSATWRAILPQLSKKYRVVAPDLFGHGESAKPRGDYSLGAFAVWRRRRCGFPSGSMDFRSIPALSGPDHCTTPTRVGTPGHMRVPTPTEGPRPR
jgi:pimeloyl-ACP methyl ester carboxylesterase